MKTILTFLLAITIFQSQAQVTLNDVTLPAKVNYESSELLLNGGGVRTKLIFKLYTAGLYLQSKSTDGGAVLKADESMAIRLVITSNKINSNNMSEAIEEGFTKSEPKITWKDWYIQKRRHVSTSQHYKNKHQLLLGLYYVSQVLFWVLAIVLAFINFDFYYSRSMRLEVISWFRDCFVHLAK